MIASDHAIRRWLEMSEASRSETIMECDALLRNTVGDDRGEKCCKLETIKAKTLRAGDD